MIYSFFIIFNHENIKFTDVINKFQRYFIILCMINSPIAELIHPNIYLFCSSLYIKISNYYHFLLLALCLEFIQNRVIKSYNLWGVTGG
jgi:hypothetical protein